MSYPKHGPEFHERLLEGVDIVDIETAETDDALVLAPDGAGGVEFRAEAGGGGLTPATYTITNDSTDRTFDANSITLDELADIVATLIRDLGGD